MFRRWRLCAVLTDGGKYERCDVYIAYHADRDDGIADEICRDEDGVEPRACNQGAKCHHSYYEHENEACPNSSESMTGISSVMVSRCNISSMYPRCAF